MEGTDARKSKVPAEKIVPLESGNLRTIAKKKKVLKESG
jgi:hypothetical protein